jgi:thiamine transport system ATP-binding protein
LQKNPLLKLEGLGAKLGKLQFCFDLSLMKKERIAILGSSGSGKSTLLNLVGGFLPPNCGKLYYEGRDITALDPYSRPVTTLFQDHNLFSHLSIRKNVALGLNPGLRLSSDDWQQVSAVLDQVGLKNLAERLPSELSGGQAQRAALARCLIRKKPILLLDEPFSALDEETRLQMLDLTKQVVLKHEISTLFVTHNKNDAETFATRILIVEAGVIVNSTDISN